MQSAHHRKVAAQVKAKAKAQVKAKAKAQVKAKAKQKSKPATTAGLSAKLKPKSTAKAKAKAKSKATVQAKPVAGRRNAASSTRHAGGSSGKAEAADVSTSRAHLKRPAKAAETELAESCSPAPAEAPAEARTGTPDATKALASRQAKATDAASPLTGGKRRRGQPLAIEADAHSTEAPAAEAETETAAASEHPEPAAAAAGASSPVGLKRSSGSRAKLDTSFALEPEARELLSRLADPDALQRDAFAAGYSALVLPLGKVTRDMVREAFTWLKAIERELSRPEARADILQTLSRSFHTVVPLQEHLGEVVPDSPEKMKDLLRVVQMLADVEAAHTQWRLMLASAEGAGASQGQAQEDHLAELYKSLKCDVSPVLEGSEDWRLIQQYVHGTSFEEEQTSRPALRSLFSVFRPAEQARFGKHAQSPNRALLWYGARLTAWLGLLAQGLRLPPKEAPDMGYEFGKGLYFTDMLGPALQACHAGEGNRAFLLLAEVGLGVSRQLQTADCRADRLPPGVQSVISPGSIEPDPSGDLRLPDGVRVPAGPGRVVSSTPIATGTPPTYNKFVVYNPAQVRMRYLVEVELLGK